MKKLLLLMVLGASGPYYAGAQDSSGIHFFKGSWEQAKAASLKEHKMIFLDCWIPSCAPCKVMEKEVFPKKDVGDYYNAHFINVTMNMETPVGRTVAKQLGANQFPTMAYMKPGGFMVKKETGGRNEQEFTKLAAEAYALKDTVTLEQEFDEGKYKDPAFVRQYFTYSLQHDNIGVNQAKLDDFVEKAGYTALYKKEYFPLLGIAATGDSIGLYFVKHLPQFVKTYGEDVVYNQLAAMYLNIHWLTSYRDDNSKDTTVYNRFKQRISSRHLPNPEFFYAAFDFYLACRGRQPDSAFAIADAALIHAKPWQYIEMAKLANWCMIGYRANRVRAAQWAEKALSLTKDEDLKTQARLLQNDLLNEPAPNVIPTPMVYGINL